jgi:hypothetical protein
VRYRLTVGKGITLANYSSHCQQQDESGVNDGDSGVLVGHIFPCDKNRIEVYGRVFVRVLEVSVGFAGNACCLLADEEFQLQV